MNQHSLSRRQFLKVLGIAGGGMALAACVAPQPAAAPAASGGEQAAAAPAAAAPAAEAASITVMAFGEPDQPAYAALAEEFMKRNGNIKVEAVFLPNDEQYYAALQTQYAGGSNPSAASMQGWGYQLFADNEVIVGVNDLRQRDGFDYAWADSVAIKQYTERNDNTFLIPMQLATMVMFYSKKLFDEAGVAYPTDDWSFDDFVGIAEKLTKTDSDQKRWGYEANGNWFRDIHWMRGTGAQEFDSLVDPKKSQFNTPALVEIVQMVAGDFFHKLGISPKPADNANGAAGIQSGVSAMKYEGPWWFPRMVTPALRDENKALDFDVVLMPKQSDGERPHRGWAEGLVIFDNAPLEPTWEFVKFAAGEDGQKIFSEKTGRIPNNYALVDSFWAPMVQKNHGLTNTKAFLTAFEKGEADVISGLPRSQYWNEVVKPVGWDPLIAGTASAADVLPMVDEGVQKILDEYWAGK